MQADCPTPRFIFGVGWAGERPGVIGLRQLGTSVNCEVAWQHVESVQDRSWRLEWDDQRRVEHSLPIIHRAGIVCGAHAPLDLFDQIADLRIWSGQSFGMAEGLSAVTTVDLSVSGRLTKARSPLSKEDKFRILDPGTGNMMSEGATGELRSRRSYTMSGYLDVAHHHAAAFTSDGFLRSGYLARVRSVGARRYFLIDGRIQDPINRGAEKVNARGSSCCFRCARCLPQSACPSPGWVIDLAPSSFPRASPTPWLKCVRTWHGSAWTNSNGPSGCSGPTTYPGPTSGRLTRKCCALGPWPAPTEFAPRNRMTTA